MKSDEHSEVMRLLPWYVNGSLRASEHDQVAAHLLHCAACRHESRWLHELQCAIQDDQAPQAMHAGLQRMRHKLDRIELAPVGAGWTRPFQAWYGRRHSWHQRIEAMRRYWLKTRFSSAHLALVVCMMLGAGWMSMSPPSATSDAPYRVLASHIPTPGQHADQAQLVVILKDGPRADAINAICSEFNARLLSGPTPEGAYVLAVDRAKFAATLQAMRRSAALRFAEPAEGTALAQP